MISRVFFASFILFFIQNLQKFREIAELVLVEDEQETSHVTFPKALCKAIIGHGGVRIRRIESDSKARIDVDLNVPDSNEAIFTITGTHRQILRAEYLLEQSV